MVLFAIVTMLIDFDFTKYGFGIRLCSNVDVTVTRVEDITVGALTIIWSLYVNNMSMVQ